MRIVNSKEQILSRISDDYTFDINQYLNEGWKLFGRAPVVFIGFTFLYFLVSFGISALDQTVAYAINVVLTPIITAGYLTAAKTLDKTGRLEFGDFFKGLDRFWHLLVLHIAVNIIVVFGLVLLILPGIWVAVALMFAFPLVALSGLGFIDGIEVSIKVINKKWFNFLLLALLIFAIILGGSLLCGIGLLAAVPLTYCVLYVCYRDIIGNEADRDLDLEDHLVSDL